MHTKLHWLPGVLLSLCGLLGQGYAYHGYAQASPQPKAVAVTVTYADGPVSYRSSANMDWKLLDARAKAVTLYPGYDLKLLPKAVVAMAQPGREAVVVRNKSGIFNVGTLIQEKPDEVASALGGYFQYLWRNLTHHHESIESYAQGYMKRKGVVSRGEGCTTPLMLSPDYGAAIPGDSAVRFAWKTEPGVSGYTFAVYDNYDDKANQLYRTEVADTTLLFTLDKPFLEKDVTYYWTVYPVGKPNCARYTFSLPKSDVFRQLETRIATLQQTLRADASLSAFVSAALYEEGRFYPEAYRAYFQAYRLSPTNELYRDGLALFLARRGLTGQAKAIVAAK